MIESRRVHASIPLTPRPLLHFPLTPDGDTGSSHLRQGTTPQRPRSRVTATSKFLQRANRPSSLRFGGFPLPGDDHDMRRRLLKFLAFLEIYCGVSTARIRDWIRRGAR